MAEPEQKFKSKERYNYSISLNEFMHLNWITARFGTPENVQQLTNLNQLLTREIKLPCGQIIPFACTVFLDSLDDLINEIKNEYIAYIPIIDTRLMYKDMMDTYYTLLSPGQNFDISGAYIKNKHRSELLSNGFNNYIIITKDKILVRHI